MLDSLLRGYDNRLRPSMGGSPTVVEIDVEVRSMGQISEMDMEFSMDCYFRQTWLDQRLAFSDHERAFTLSVAMLERLWKPDTYIHNGRRSHLHVITTPNKLIRLYPSGRILYSSRLTIHATCPMDLRDFPMDTHHCLLLIYSYLPDAYTTRDVIYRWNDNRQIVIASDMRLSQFDLIAAPSSFQNITRTTGQFSVLKASFYLQRRMGNFLIQVYGPCMLLVVLSWVSFLLNREATADRISLGVMTVLTMTFLGLEARADLPRVSYSTALDIFVWISFGFIFATIVEFAFVHYFTKFGSGEQYWPVNSDKCENHQPQQPQQQNHRQQSEQWQPRQQPLMPRQSSVEEAIACKHNTAAASRSTSDVSLDEQLVTSDQDTPQNTPNHQSSPASVRSSHSTPHSNCSPSRCSTRAADVIDITTYNASGCSKGLPVGLHYCKRHQNNHELQYIHYHQHTNTPSHQALNNRQQPKLKQTTVSERHMRGRWYKRLRPRCCPRRQFVTSLVPAVNMKKKEDQRRKRRSCMRQMNSVSQIDQVSRIVFPICFVIMNLIYWYSYITHSQRLIYHLPPPRYASATS
ncbi:gamma-aminobutyric acid receptor alpha-like [Hyalella azteca]|uniref:Gamma-aminobutyric acid receptor alpha-like n=2 Tax=Hyalella azteca TaxID=294128 RepID=A0A979FRF2_HYAAZ|nr:gamma-aminobutyric acid receptor alpha-like [Hyalella azteca]